MIPITDFSVLVLPAPLRPSSVTTSPSFTWKLTPCRMCDSPYQACKSLTDNTCAPLAFTAGPAAVVVSGMTGSQIGFLDARVLGEIGISAFGEHVTARQHGDDVGKVGDDDQVMLDHQDSVFRRNALDQGR